MKEQAENKIELIKGIEQDAKQEAECVVAEAEKEAEARRKACGVQVESILDEAKKKAQNQSQAIMSANKSNIKVETRRIFLKRRGDIIKNIINKVEEKLAQKIKSSAYKEILVNWIVEAVIGLNTDKAVINVSQKELKLIDNDVIKSACRKIESLVHKKVELTCDSKNPLVAQGVVLYTEDKKMAFNNQVPTRLLRYQSEIRKLIYEELFKEIREE
jgi:vacuolar-type H+-ATPase subunit E/Vma4